MIKLYYNILRRFCLKAPSLLLFVQVTGFSVGGRVIDGNDMGVEGVKIIVDGQERSITDKQGYYKLDQV